MQNIVGLSRRLRTLKWNIGFVCGAPASVIRGDRLRIRWMKHGYADRWFADPFILGYDSDTIEVLVEEFLYSTRLGRIAKLTIDRNTLECMSSKPVLELDTHLSFPYIVRCGDTVYMMPENSASSKLNLYAYDRRDDSVSFVNTVCERPLADATIVSAGGKEYVLSTEVPRQNKNVLDIYSFDPTTMTMGGKVEEAVFTGNVARNAGDAFLADGALYRAAQDCNLRYGHGIVIQRIDCSADGLRFTEVASFYPDCRKYGLGIHTFNVMGDLAVVDGHGYRYPLIGPALDAVAAVVRRMRA